MRLVIDCIGRSIASGRIQGCCLRYWRTMTPCIGIAFATGRGQTGSEQIRMDTGSSNNINWTSCLKNPLNRSLDDILFRGDQSYRERVSIWKIQTLIEPNLCPTRTLTIRWLNPDRLVSTGGWNSRFLQMPIVHNNNLKGIRSMRYKQHTRN